MTQRALREGHSALMRRLYEPDAYLGRIFKGYTESAFRARRTRHEAQIGAARPRIVLLRSLADVRVAIRLSRTLARRKMLRRLGPVYARFFARNLALGRAAMPFHQYVTLCLTHWHPFNMARHRRKMTFGNPMLEGRVALPAD
jgi:hypothetical protein